MALEEPKGNLVTPVGFHDGLPYALLLTLQGSLITRMLGPAGEPTGQPDWYIDRYNDVATDTNVQDTAPYLDLTAILTGDVVVVENVSVRVDSASVTRLTIELLDGATTYEIGAIETPASGRWYGINGSWTLKEGDAVRVTAETLTTGDDLRIRAWGRVIQD